jgi:hypothetical protein
MIVHLIYLGLGLFVGTCAGVWIASLCEAAHRAADCDKCWHNDGPTTPGRWPG